ncbi:ankyrin repeat protein [Niemeyer virus]|uniref:Putative ankyrin repeat protein R578 n=5 Tax=Mimivirus TaxID=315393 RepID=YR578_MIMIV|nr:putative ankyrin repeat protein [Acanthamoeba polyphaga mimivirus]Q5UR94.1 RecName: Full=Putative ankyrin repeat protein R578 [Acanthamoeba polyphaga mimivirus]AHJ40225.1 ankyrin repeat protein [Samba virus]ALR84166.1 ankyrin repeat protein [Niemeyer virus]AAV50841.1 unknown [Acanthamoeba polyphaga mimivirus]ADO18718.1 putative ankyrin repeat protein [Acanthamoeba polyphaga mimivirus]AKI81249.1 putative ankyrin repeat protein [Acanthamoeba polyphaga mimivirus]
MFSKNRNINQFQYAMESQTEFIMYIPDAINSLIHLLDNGSIIPECFKPNLTDINGFVGNLRHLPNKITSIETGLIRQVYFHGDIMIAGSVMYLKDIETLEFICKNIGFRLSLFVEWLYDNKSLHLLESIALSFPSNDVSYLLESVMQYRQNDTTKLIFNMFPSEYNKEIILRNAVITNNLEMLEFAIEKGAILSETDHLIVQSIRTSNLDLIKYIFSHIDLSKLIKLTDTVYYIYANAVYHYSHDVIVFLIESCIDYPDDLLFKLFASNQDCHETIDYIINLKYPDQNELNNILIHICRHSSQSEKYKSVYNSVEKLIELGADFTIDNYQVVIDILKSYFPNVVEIFVKNGLNPNVNPNILKTSIYCCNNFDITKYLIDNGADIHSDPSLIKTAITSGNLKTATFLMDNGAICDESDCEIITKNRHIFDNNFS